MDANDSKTADKKLPFKKQEFVKSTANKKKPQDSDSSDSVSIKYRGKM